MSDISACILSVSGPVLTEAEARLLSDVRPWGMILMGRSCVSKAQVSALVKAIHEAAGHEVLVFIDQEGGRVARLKGPEWPLFPRGADYGALYQQDRALGLEACFLGHRLIAHELTALGIHADCAPVLDIPRPGAHDVIGDRALGETPAQVAALGRAAIDGLHAGGVASVIKHIPGHGRSMADSHLELPRVTADESELAADFEPFRELSDAPMAMTAHIAYEAVDPGVPATSSEKLITQTIRGRIGFDGLLMSDDLGMAALGGTLASRARAAIAAGCDMLLHCSGFLKDADAILAEMREVGEAAPVLKGKALQRAQAASAIGKSIEPFDAESGRARLDELMSGRALA